MKKLFLRSLIYFTLACVLVFTMSCSMDFEQASVTYKSFKLDELPGVLTKITINADVLNNDERDADISKIVYTVTVEGVVSEEMTYETPFTLAGGATKNMDMPLTFKTDDAASLLLVLKKDAEINYTVKGTMYAVTPVGELELPLEITGKATVTFDFDEYFKQPTINVSAINYEEARPTENTTEMIFFVNVVFTNNAPYTAKLKSVKYTVTIDDGPTSSLNTYIPEDILIGQSSRLSGPSINLYDMPASFPVNSGNLIALGAIFDKVGDESVNYTISGTMILNADIGTGASDFTLPLFNSGSMYISPK